MARAVSCAVAAWREYKMLKAYSVTDIGKSRKMNQDYIFVSEKPLGKLPNLFIVADGMGGHKAGDYASKYAVETVAEEVSHSLSENPVAVLRAAIDTANERIRRKARENIEMSGMGTTMVAATCQDRMLTVANVGDSRLYVVNRGIRQITRDHSLVEEMVRMGSLDRAEARKHPNKNIITRAVGADEEVVPDFFTLELEAGDTVLMCSDGLTNMLEDAEICAILNTQEELDAKAAALVEKANNNGGKDNIAVILIRIF